MEQVERTKRYLERIRSFYKGIPSPYHSINGFEDDVISFFMHCYHIKDWIFHLNKKGLKRSELDEFINNNLDLRICADFCNGSKHCKLTRGRRTSSQPHIIGKNHWRCDYASIDFPKRESTERATFQLLANNEIYDVLELAERCYALWIQYIEEKCT